MIDQQVEIKQNQNEHHTENHFIPKIEESFHIKQQTPMTNHQQSKAKSISLIDQLNETKIQIASKQNAQTQQKILKRIQQLQHKIQKKLTTIYNFYRKLMYVQGQSFEINSKLMETIDLKVFMKYYKDFQIKLIYPINDAHELFKKLSTNSLWLDLQKFIKLHILLIKPKDFDINQKLKELKVFNTLISSEKVKKMLNADRPKCVVIQFLVHEHSGNYKMDIINKLKEKSKERKQKMNLRYHYLKTQERQSVKTNYNASSIRVNTLQNDGRYVKHSKSEQKLNTNRQKSQTNTNIFDDLKLPKLRVKEMKQQSIYKSLDSVQLRAEKKKIKNLVNQEEHEQYLDQYLKNQFKLNEKKKKEQMKRALELPRMRFT